MKNKLFCPHCGSQDNEIVDTRLVIKTTVSRAHFCNDCCQFFSTKEVIDPGPTFLNHKGVNEKTRRLGKNLDQFDMDFDGK